MIKVEVDRRRDLGPVRDQGPNPTCLSHATTTAHEVRRGGPRPMSAEFLHFHANGGNFRAGATPVGVRHSLSTTGQPAQQLCAPYVTGQPWAPPAAVQTYRGAAERLQSLATVISSIRDGWHPVLCIAITEDFLDPKRPWVFAARDTTLGLHAVVAAGLGAFNGSPAILVRNSWGPDWADQGHAWLAQSYLEKHLLHAYAVEAN